MEAALAVLIPVFNGFDATRRCLDAVARHTPARCAVMLIDDASTDPRVAPMLAAFAAAHPATTLLTNERNLGFPGTVNRGIEAAAGDVVVLNSDTIVTAGWIEGLERCRDSHGAIGIVCPLSNRATILSIPGIVPLFAGADGSPDVDAIARCVAQASARSYPLLPTAVGFCMLLTRRTLETVGSFDPAYGRGYGEECDLSMRALDQGLRIACADDVYVHHASEASFGGLAGLDALRAGNARLLDRRWPMYSSGVRAWSLANPLRPVFERIIAAAERLRMPGRPRVLQVLHRFESRGGVEEHTRALVNGLKGEVAFTVAHPIGPAGAWTDMADERPAGHVRIVRFNPDLATEGIRVIGHRASVRDTGIENAFRALLSGGFDVVHLQSMVGWNTLALARIARESGARVVLSAHDMAMMCGDYNMMAPGDGAPCGRMRARGDDEGCVTCLRGKSTARTGAIPTIAHYIEERHAAAADAVAASDAIVCPSRFAAGRVHAAFGDGVKERCRVIGHGVARAAPLERHSGRPMLTVAFVGRFTGRKGSTEVLETARALAGQRILIEVHGPCDDPLVAQARAAGIVLRGPYDPIELPERLRGVDLVIAPSILEETYCLVASEAQMLGIPIVASDQGAPPERIRENETGFLVPPGNSAALTKLLLGLRDDRPRLEAVAARLRVERPATIESNVAEYLDLYRSLASGARPPPPLAGDDDGEAVGRAFNLPRKRRRTPLGDDRYDRWLEGEPAPVGSAAQEPTLIRFAAGAAQDDLAALNRAIAASPTEWIAFAQEGDTVAAGALATLAEAALRHPGAELFYTDDDVASSRGERYGPAFKPAFDPELLRHLPYLAGLCAVRKDSLIARGGFEAPGWLGVIGLALQLAEEHLAAKVVRVPVVGVHRQEANLRALEDEAFAREHERRTAERLRRAGGAPMLLGATNDAPAMWAYAPAATARVSALVVGASSPAAVDACIASMVRRCGARLAEIFIDLPAAQATSIVERHARGGALPILSIGQPSIGHALLRASTPWLVVADARCVDFTAGWLERLEQGIAGDHVAAIAPYVRQRDGPIAAGWEVVGGGPWAVAGAAPQADVTRQSQLLHAPRQVGTLAGRLLLVRREAAIASGGLTALEGAGPWQAQHLGLALRAAGHTLVSLPYVAATFDGHASPPATRDPVGPLQPPAAAVWMRERWAERLKSDPYFPAELALDEDRPRPVIRFKPRRGSDRKRLCVFPFDRGGSGEMRVRQPCESLAAAGRCELVTMPEHDAGVAPNALAWERLDADVMYALNFFHDAQLRALEAGAPQLRVLGMDDLMTDLPRDNPFARTVYPDIGDRIRRALERCDRLVVSTPALAQAYGSQARDVRVIPNAIDLARWPAPVARPERRRLRVGWAGAAQHLHDLRLIAPVVEATADEFEWVFFGLCPPEMRAWAAEVHPMVPVGRYPGRLARLGFDIAVAPLVDHPFNRAKSALKVLEYGALALPVVASDIEPYRTAPVSLVGDDPEDWIEALRSIARSSDAGRERGRNLRRWIEKTGTLQVQITAWESALGLDA
jgi:glycosyltransferase involved in cell wall biosynthesis/GT2 family glycosyltransferase